MLKCVKQDKNNRGVKGAQFLVVARTLSVLVCVGDTDLKLSLFIFCCCRLRMGIIVKLQMFCKIYILCKI